MLWLKAFHIIFIVCWFAGLFYLPRLYVHHAMAEDRATIERLKIMERKLYRFVTPFAAATIVLGIWMLALRPDYYLTQGWMHAKLFFVVLLIAYHHVCLIYLKQFAQDRCTKRHVFFRWFNELPVIALVAIVIFAVVKPF